MTGETRFCGMFRQGNPQWGMGIGVAAQAIFEAKMFLSPFFVTTAAMRNYPPLTGWMPHMAVQTGNLMEMSPAIAFIGGHDGGMAFGAVGKGEALGNFTTTPGAMGKNGNNKYEAKQRSPRVTAK